MATHPIHPSLLNGPPRRDLLVHVANEGAGYLDPAESSPVPGLVITRTADFRVIHAPSGMYLPTAPAGVDEITDLCVLRRALHTLGATEDWSRYQPHRVPRRAVRAWKAAIRQAHHQQDIADAHDEMED